MAGRRGRPKKLKDPHKVLIAFNGEDYEYVKERCGQGSIAGYVRRLIHLDMARFFNRKQDPI